MEQGMTVEQQEAARKERLNEVGREAPCPMCGRPRVTRSTYIRCNPCGTNWMDGEDRGKDPRITRYVALIESLKPLTAAKTRST